MKIEIRNNFGQILSFDKNLAKDRIAVKTNSLANRELDAKGHAYRTDFTPDEIKEKMKAFSERVLSIDEDKLQEIADHLPTNKNGSWTRKRTVLFISDVIIHQGDAGMYYAPEVPALIIDTYGWDEKELDVCIQTVPYEKKMTKMFNDDDTLNKIVNVKRTYVNFEDLIPGKIYEDAKENKFLCVGVIDKGRGIEGGVEKNLYDFNVFIKLNDKRIAEMKKFASFKDWLLDHVAKFQKKNAGRYWITNDSIYRIWDSFKVMDTDEVMYAPSEMFVEVPGIFSIIDKKFTKKYMARISYGKHLEEKIFDTMAKAENYAIEKQIEYGTSAYGYAFDFFDIKE